MSELSLQGHESALVELADETKMSDQRLQNHIEELEKTQASALEHKLGRQAEAATRLLIHFRFEQSQRAGVPAAVYAETATRVEDQESTDVSELVGASVETATD